VDATVQSSNDFQTNSIDLEAYNTCEDIATSSTAIVLRPTQYSQLMQVINKYNAEQEKNNTNDVTAISFLAGKRCCFLTTSANNAWILDSGASDHITPDLSLLHEVKLV